MPKLPNILITGTPGCGKTQHSEKLKERLNFTFINVSALAIEKNLHDGKCTGSDSYLLDDDKVLDELEGPIAEGGCIVDHHTCGFFPERFFQLVIVLRTDNTVLYDRLEARGYSQSKLEGNVQCEIMQVVATEAAECYDEDVVVILDSDTEEQLNSNVERIIAWIGEYMRNNADAE
jgi:adenylate kinase